MSAATEVLYTVEHMGFQRLRVPAISEAKISKYACITLKKNYVYLGLVEGIFNTAGLEVIINTFVLQLLSSNQFFFIAHSYILYNSLGFLEHEIGFFLSYFLEQTCRAHTNLIQCASSRPVQLLSECS